MAGMDSVVCNWEPNTEIHLLAKIFSWQTNQRYTLKPACLNTYTFWWVSWYNLKCNFPDQRANIKLLKRKRRGKTLPQPPHVTVLVREKAIRVVTAIFHVDESTTENRPGVIFWFRTQESVHICVGGVVVAWTKSSHCHLRGTDLNPDQFSRDNFARAIQNVIVKLWVARYVFFHAKEPWQNFASE